MGRPFVDLMKREAKGFAPSGKQTRSAPEVEPVEDGRPYPNEHAARLTDPDQYDRIRRVNDDLGAGVDAIYGIKEDTSRRLVTAILRVGH